jgi:hypothetical protein
MVESEDNSNSAGDPGSRAEQRGSDEQRSSAEQRAGRRADFGAPIESFFEKQPPAQRAILDELLALIREAAPQVQGSIKWGNPFFTIDGNMVCALTSHKAHVNLVLWGPSEAFTDPEHRLSGTGKAGLHLKVTDVSQIPRDSVLEWVRTAAKLAAKKRG